MAANTNYRTIREDRKMSLEAEFSSYMQSGMVEQAYQTFGTLMKYGLIDRYDLRLSPDYPGFKGLKDAPKFEWDYRDKARGALILPMNIHFDCDKRLRSNLVALKHVGKRVEGGYTGDVMVEERQMPIYIMLNNTSASAKKALDSFAARYQELTGKYLETSSLEDDLAVGFRKIYGIQVQETVSVTYRQLGHAMVYTTDKGIQIMIALYHKALKNNWIRIDSAYAKIGDAIKESLIAKNTGVDPNRIYACSVSDFKVIMEEAKAVNKQRLIDIKAMEDRRNSPEAIVVPLKAKGEKKKDTSEKTKKTTKKSSKSKK